MAAIVRAVSAVRPMVGHRAFSAVPINGVARIIRFHVDGEESALKVDDAIREILPECKKQPGYVSTTRTVCKAEWAYEIAVKFDSLDNFKAYMASDFRNKAIVPQLEKIKQLAKDPDQIYSGNRVCDELEMPRLKGGCSMSI